MELIYGVCHLNSKEDKKYFEDKYGKNFIHDNVTIQTQRNQTTQTDCLHSYYSNYVYCSFIGYFTNINELKKKFSIQEVDNIHVIHKLYQLKGEKCFTELDGVFTIVIYDQSNKKILVYQDENGSNLPLYYTKTENKVVFSTSLKEILKNIPPKSRILDKNAALSFLSNHRFHKQHIVSNERTLIAGIYKIIPNTLLIVDCNNVKCKTKKVNSRPLKYTRSDAKEKLISSIEDVVRVLSTNQNCNEVVSTQSSGFDSNLIVNMLSKVAKKVKTFTIGGKIQNEISAAKQIARCYKNVQNQGETVDVSCFQKFPEMVWRLEGYVYQKGIFLQYCLANILKMNNVSTFFCGEGADQILDAVRLSKIKALQQLEYDCLRGRIKEKRILVFQFFSGLKEILQPKMDGIMDYVLKKNGIMMNSFGISVFYPYVNKKTKYVSKSLGMMNVRKTFFKQEVNKYLGDLGKLLSKGKGDTDLEYLIENETATLNRVLETDFAKTLLNKNQIKAINKKMLENLDIIFTVLYIYLFNELFISGKFDYQFGKAELEVCLKDMI